MQVHVSRPLRPRATLITPIELPRGLHRHDPSRSSLPAIAAADLQRLADVLAVGWMLARIRTAMRQSAVQTAGHIARQNSAVAWVGTGVAGVHWAGSLTNGLHS